MELGLVGPPCGPSPGEEAAGAHSMSHEPPGYSSEGRWAPGVLEMRSGSSLCAKTRVLFLFLGILCKRWRSF